MRRVTAKVRRLGRMSAKPVLTDDEEVMLQKLAGIRKRLEAASEGPWDVDCHYHLEKGCRCLSCGDNATGWFMETPSTLDCEDRSLRMYPTDEERDRHEHCTDGPFVSYEDADFAAHAREDIPFLLELIEKLGGPQ